MAVNRFRSVGGFTLVEIMVAMVVLAIATLGALGYEYYAARQAYSSNAEVTAMRTALLLLEDWKGTGGSSRYDPTALGLGFSSFSSAGSNGAIYAVTVNDVPMLVKLKWKDIAHDDVAQTTLREIAVAVSWEQSQEEGRRAFNTRSGTGDCLANFATYVRLDASGGY